MFRSFFRVYGLGFYGLGFESSNLANMCCKEESSLPGTPGRSYSDDCFDTLLMIEILHYLKDTKL